MYTIRIELGVLESRLYKEIYFKHAVAFFTLCSIKSTSFRKVKGADFFLVWY